MQDIVAAQAVAQPDKIAIVSPTAQWSYADFDSAARRIATHLGGRGIGPGCVVGLCLDRSADTIAAILGVLHAGAAFLPLDPAYPAERLRYMLEDAKPIAVLVNPETEQTLPGHSGETILLDQVLEVSASTTPDVVLDPESLAYVIYTSGSTGRPKGVMVPHRGIENLAREQIRLFGVDSDSRILQFASLNFDAAIAEIAVALCAGASLHVARPEQLMPVRPLAEILGARRITHVTIPPSLAALMPTEALPTGLTLILAGEPCGGALVFRLVQDHTVFNAYGPTETTVCATVGECVADGNPPSIGKPIDGVDVLILDETGQVAPFGITGEILIGGLGVALGYLGQPTLTAERFVTLFDQRWYRTGDLGRQRDDGQIDFIGRIDRQLKLHGHRIEPGEIETALTLHPDVAVAAVKLHGADKQAKLVAYVAGHTGCKPDISCLRRHLSELIPSWMIPASFIVIDAFQRTPNGKIDWERLPDPENLQIDHARYLAPRDSIEVILTVACGEILGRDKVSLRDCFLAIGGTSLAAARLSARMEQETGRTLPLDAFSPGVTLEELAVILRCTNDRRAFSPLVPLATHGIGPPLFLVHPAGGTVLPYLELAKALSGVMPVYGLQASGIEQEEIPLDRVEEMAEQFICAARESLNPKSWRIAGWSFGAAVAFEMVRQLRRQGEYVAPPLVLDAPAEHMAPSADEADIVQRVIGMYGEMQAIQPSMGENDKSGEGISNMVEAAVKSGIFPPDFSASQARRLAAVIAGCFSAGQNYAPPAADGDMILVRAADNPIPSDDPLLGWGNLVRGSVDLRYVPGTHTSMLREPHVSDLAETLVDVLSDKAMVEAGSAPV